MHAKLVRSLPGKDCFPTLESRDGWLENLYRTHSGPLRRFVRSFVDDPEDAEDVVHQVFAKLAAEVRWEWRDAPFEAWLYRVARNAALDHRRAARRRSRVDIEHCVLSSDDAARDARLEVSLAVGKLPKQERQVVLLRHLVGLNSAEIGVEISRSAAAVDGLQHRARRRLMTQTDRLAA